jgi:hypothetical protein
MQETAAPAFTSPLHFASMTQDNWGTPSDIVRRAHDFLGGPPDLDPASDAERNQVVGAKRWLGLEHMHPRLGIPIDWGDARTIFLNPPGGCRPDKVTANGKPIGPSFVSLFWKKAIAHLLQVSHEDPTKPVGLVWVAYNINQLQTLQQVDSDALRACCLCVPDVRVKYLDRDNAPRSGTPSASAILGLTGDPSNGRFDAAFRSLGAVWVP